MQVDPRPSDLPTIITPCTFSYRWYRKWRLLLYRRHGQRSTLYETESQLLGVCINTLCINPWRWEIMQYMLTWYLQNMFIVCQAVSRVLWHSSGQGTMQLAIQNWSWMLSLRPWSAIPEINTAHAPKIGFYLMHSEYTNKTLPIPGGGSTMTQNAAIA
jgi:hypothetical protein